MQRSAGVLTVAIVVLVASILILALGVLTAAFLLVMPHIPRPADRPPLPVGGVLVIGSLFYILPGIWGIVSGIGLLRLKNWARISTIVFAVLAGMGGVMMLVGTLVFLNVPMPPPEEGLDPAAATRVLTIMRAVMGVLSSGLLGIAIWFGVLLTRPGVVRQFTGDTGESSRATRPLSISIIAVLMLLGVPMVLFALFLGAPSSFFLTILVGRAAAVYFLALAGILAYCGWGLLRLRPAARLIAIGYFVFAILSSAVFFLAPDRDSRIAALVRRQPIVTAAFSPASRMPPQPPPQTIAIFGGLVGVLGTAIPLYFLIARRAAFVPPPSDPIWPDAPG